MISRTQLSQVSQNDSSATGWGNLRPAFLRDSTITGADLSNVCAELRRTCDPLGSSTDVRPALTPLRQLQDSAEIASGRGRFLHFALTPNREVRLSSDQDAGPI